MGSLLRTILIFAIVYYLFKKVGGFFYRTVSGSPDPQPDNNSQRGGGSPSREGEIRVEKKSTQGKKSGADFKGGEYVEFEEVD